ncbi:Zn-dependent hydrolase [Bhargavaea ginsengi]|uniref:Zn-dependent hydrolase n=1 Tax=Bhargavaea ginsengi TaxID=426757 RepID=UPI003C75E58D
MRESVRDRLLAGYDGTADRDGVSGKRLAGRLAALASIGETEDGGVNRPGFSAEEKRAKEQVMEWMREAGLDVRMDGAGNVIGRLEGKTDGPAFAAGSHVDSVPNGGNFDGPLGVLSALEVVEAWKETGYVPPVPVEVIIFSEEEGSRFGAGIMGSQAMTGDLGRDALSVLSDADGNSFEEVISAYGTTVDQFRGAARDLKEIGFYAEIHIEQGKLLEQAGLPAGIVKGIAGPAWLNAVFRGTAGHAGNTPMIGRRDPLVAAGRFVHEVSSLPAQFSDTAVATVGKLNVSPNGANVIPEEVALTVDIRDLDKEARDGLVQKVRETAEHCAAEAGVEVELNLASSIDPMPVTDEVREELAQVFGQAGIRPMELMSGAGHDAMILGRHVPMAMIFVKSIGGISHNPAEWSDLDDCITAVHLLKRFAEKRMEKMAGHEG